MIKYFLLGGLLITISIVLILHTYFPLKTSALAVVEDVTDEQIKKPSFEEVIGTFNLSEDKWNGAIFYYSRLTDISLNEFKVTKLPARRFCLSNEFMRKDEIEEFSKTISENLSQTKNAGRKNSSVYVPIVKALTFLVNTEADTKVLLIYSDLMENTDKLSLYDKDTLEKVKENPSKIQSIYESTITLPDLNGISIYLIYHPGSPLEDERFQLVSGFYKIMLENRGAKVFIQANM